MTDTLRNFLLILTPVLFIANLVQSLFYLPESARRESGGHMSNILYYFTTRSSFCFSAR